ncbi:MAG: TlpA family protein disulfide reductase [Gammaproteobacteria bacterium]|nr:TlpA family protein disulfide reductase [Gammaproteobacteria bacterium]
MDSPKKCVRNGFLGFCLLLIAACGGTDKGVDFALRDVDGALHRLSDYRGRWVVVNFWATWCGPCLAEIPELNRLAEKHAERVRVIGINFEEIDAETLRRFIARHRIGYLVVRNGDQPIVPFEPLKGLPASFFIDPDGNYVARQVGRVSFSMLEKFLREEAAF